MNGWEIGAARCGGFVVMRPFHESVPREIAFAGTLDECLSFIRCEMTPKPGNNQARHNYRYDLGLEVGAGRGA